MTAIDRILARAARPVFVAYAIALETVTHWPRLALGADAPVTDKSIHFAAFALLAVLLRLTGWLRRPLLVALVAAAWAALDEISQGLPGLHRDVSRIDLAANLLGVIAAAAWIAALDPRRGGRSNAPRGRRLVRAGLVTAGAAAAGAAAVVAAAFVTAQRLDANLPDGIGVRVRTLLALIPPDTTTAARWTVLALVGALFVGAYRGRAR